MPSIALVGMACCYPDARSPVELWENELAQRQAFRRVPPGRLRLEDYFSADRGTPDRTYATQAAVIAGYDFDRLRFRVSRSTFRSTDLTHWLALDVACQALADAGYPDAEGLPRETTAAIVGNTLTGEFSRANQLRLRWPFVRRVVEANLTGAPCAPQQRRAFLEKLEGAYKQPFPPVGEETLAGGLSNTIAGRICNHLDLQGGGWTVDGACASSLLAVTTACQSLVAGDIDVAVAGGVDLSLDPFELVGFAKAGALAQEEMRVYDVRSAGFWPGEGCGFVVLMRQDDALAQGRRIYALIRGWGTSSDGGGGITRPEVKGQSLALRRAYRRAGFPAHTVAFIEGHGTGTATGDTVELQALTQVRREEAPDSPPATIGSIKANIGHTKAAAGVAGLIKATMALYTQILPPTSGCTQPHTILSSEDAALQVLARGRRWPRDRLLRAGVSAMGFGGINAHLVLEAANEQRREPLSAREQVLLRSSQDAEVFLFSASSFPVLTRRVDHVLGFAAALARSELSDLAARLADELDDGPVRLAVVASTPQELASRLETARTWLREGEHRRLDAAEGTFLAWSERPPRLGFLFPGQGAPVYVNEGAFGKRFDFLDLPAIPEESRAAHEELPRASVQPAIVAASLAALRVMTHLGIDVDLAIGHSLGELTALHWAGAFPTDVLRRITARRGAAMTEMAADDGAMATIQASRSDVDPLLNGGPVVVACLNAPRQTVISGERTAVATVLHRARERGYHTAPLPVLGAFHSPLVIPALPALAQALAEETLQPLHRRVISTVTGAELAPDDDLRELLCRQLTSPVRFVEAVAAAGNVDLWLELGPGRMLAGLLRDMSETPAVAVDAGGPSLKGLLTAVGAAFALGVPIKARSLFAERFTRPFDLDYRPRFFENPCEQAPVSGSTSGEETVARSAQPEPTKETVPASEQGTPTLSSVLVLVQQLVAARIELPAGVVRGTDRLLKDLHLNSIAVGQLVVEATRRLGLPPTVSPTDFADATVAEMAVALEERARIGGMASVNEDQRFPPGVDSWIRTFIVELRERPLPPRRPLSGSGTWKLFCDPDHALREPLELQLLSQNQGNGVVVCLPPEPDERSVSLLLAGARAVLKKEAPAHFVLVQHGGGANAFARTLHLEAQTLTTCVVDVPAACPEAADWILTEVQSASGYSEAHYDMSGRRSEPNLAYLPEAQEAEVVPLGEEDVIVITGGGKGIAAECALELARSTGVSLALVGRSRPEIDAVLADNLKRLTAAGVRWRYYSADVANAEEVQAALTEVVATLGPITAVIHAAGANTPCLIASLQEEDFLQALAPKVRGLRNVLAAADPAKLRILVAFGSLIARTGMRGEAHYALANEWLTREAERWQILHPHCRCLALEWSVWSGVGMGQHLGRIDALAQQGITPISPDEGIRVLVRLLCQQTPPAAIVTGRFGAPPTVNLEPWELPLRRFLERPRLFYPGVELISEADLSQDADPYLDDHVFRGDRLFPAALAIEAVAQVAQALAGTDRLPTLEQLQFSQPIVVPDGGTVTIRLAALLRSPGIFEVVIRSQTTAFQVNHVRALCRVSSARPTDGEPQQGLLERQLNRDVIPLDPQRDLYGQLLFQAGRFRKLRAFRELRATTCFAEVVSEERTDWFNRYLPAPLALGDPGLRDAAMHAIQSCIPHLLLLPIGLERLTISAAPAWGLRYVSARERSCCDGTFIYDVAILGLDGQLLEQWEGLQLRRVTEAEPHNGWLPTLLGPYLERRFKEVSPHSDVAVVVENGADAGQPELTLPALRRALGDGVSIFRRPDGKPVTADGHRELSAAHGADLTMAVAGKGSQGCDLEEVVARSEPVWRAVLGADGYRLSAAIAKQQGEDEATAATRVWAARECLKKAGMAHDIPLVVAIAEGGDWVVLGAGSGLVATCRAVVRGRPASVVFAAFLRSEYAGF